MGSVPVRRPGGRRTSRDDTTLLERDGTAYSKRYVLIWDRYGNPFFLQYYKYVIWESVTAQKSTTEKNYKVIYYNMELQLVNQNSSCLHETSMYSVVHNLSRAEFCLPNWSYPCPSYVLVDGDQMMQCLLLFTGDIWTINTDYKHIPF